MQKKDKKLESEIERAANQILRGSIELFKEESYWNCARELIILMDFYPDFGRLDEVVYYLARCLFEEELTTAAIRMYKYLIKKFPTSSFVPASILGLQKAYYYQKN